jgi:signal transduction histidine kinase
MHRIDRGLSAEAASTRRRVTARSGKREKGAAHSPLASLFSAANVITSGLLSGELTPRQVRAMVRVTAKESAVSVEASGLQLYRLVLSELSLFSTDPDAALEAELTALVAFTGARSASFWFVDAVQEVRAVSVGPTLPSRQLRRVARRVVAAGAEQKMAGDSILHAFPVMRWNHASGALIVAAEPRLARRARAYTQLTAFALSPLVERKEQMSLTVRAAQEFLRASDRRVARLGFDIHDGPLQDLTLLSAELTELERQLKTLVTSTSVRRSIANRVVGLKTAAVAVGEELREIISTTRGGAIPLGRALEQAAAHLERRSCIKVRLKVEGDVEHTTASQRIAVARVVEEALANVREHSGARHVSVTVRREDGLLHLAIVDDGHGFDVQRERSRAVRDRRFGLVNMAERVSLLGGRLEIESGPKGPTTISASLPAWESAGVPRRVSGRGARGASVVAR